MKFDILLNTLNNNNLSPIYLILGNESYQSKKILDAFAKLIPDDEKSFNIIKYDMENINLSKAINEALSFPFIGNRKLVVITNPYFLNTNSKIQKIKHNINDLINYINNPLDSTILLIFAPYDRLDNRKTIVKLLNKKSTIIDNKPLNKREFRNFILKDLHLDGYNIDIDALNELIVRTGNNLSVAMSELNKLKNFVSDKKIITLYEVTHLVSMPLKQNIFKLSDLIICGKTQLAMDFYHNLILHKEDPIKINAILIDYFRLLLQMKILFLKNYKMSDIINILHVHPYRARLVLSRLDSLDTDVLENTYLNLVENDFKLKSTNMNSEVLFQIFLLKFSLKK